MRHKNTGTFSLTTDQDEWPEDFTLLLQALPLIFVIFLLYVKKGHLFRNCLNQRSYHLHVALTLDILSGGTQGFFFFFAMVTEDVYSKHAASSSSYSSTTASSSSSN